MLACLIRLAGRRFHLIVSERSLTQRLDLKTRLKFFLYRFSDYVVPNSHAESDFIARNIPALQEEIGYDYQFCRSGSFLSRLYVVQGRKNTAVVVCGICPESKKYVGIDIGC